jgi:outer membrane protein TolC
MRRMFALAAGTAEPLAAQAAEERLRLYESGRGMFDEVLAAMRRRLQAAHDAAQARHDYHLAEAMLWMAAGARPDAGGHGTKDGGR